MKIHRGIDLRIKRVRAGLRQQDVADAMGVSRQRVSQLELDGASQELGQRYLEALKAK